MSALDSHERCRSRGRRLLFRAFSDKPWQTEKVQQLPAVGRSLWAESLSRFFRDALHTSRRVRARYAPANHCHVLRLVRSECADSMFLLYH